MNKNPSQLLAQRAMRDSVYLTTIVLAVIVGGGTWLFGGDLRNIPALGWGMLAAVWFFSVLFGFPKIYQSYLQQATYEIIINKESDQ